MKLDLYGLLIGIILAFVLVGIQLIGVSHINKLKEICHDTGGEFKLGQCIR